MYALVLLFAAGVIATPLKTKLVENYRQERSNLYYQYADYRHAIVLFIPGTGNNSYPDDRNAPDIEHTDAVPLEFGPRSDVLKTALVADQCPTGYERIDRDCVISNPCEKGRTLLYNKCIPKDK